MKNFIAIVIMSIVLLSSYTIAGGTRPPENKYVKCDIVLQKKQLKAGTTGQLLITLKPIRGIHVNTIRNRLRRGWSIGQALAASA